MKRVLTLFIIVFISPLSVLCGSLREPTLLKAAFRAKLAKTRKERQLLAFAFSVTAQEPPRPKRPMLTNDDLGSTGVPRSAPEESINPSTSSATAITNPRRTLEGILAKMNEVTSVRTRLQASLPGGQRDVLIESVKPDRMHIKSADGESFVIGRKLYMKVEGTWRVLSMPTGSQSDAFDFQGFVKGMLAKSQVRVSGQVLGTQNIEGVDTIVYEFNVTDRSDTGTIQIAVGKTDGYMRRMSIQGGDIAFKVWCSDINEPISIEPPM